MKSKEISKIHFLGVNAENLLGYLYSGILILLTVSILEPIYIKNLRDVLGSLLLLISAMCFGVIFYTVYFRIIGVFIFFPLQYYLHDCLDSILSKSDESLTSTTKFLSYLGVRKGFEHNAYEEIKSNYLPDNSKQILYLQHGELHLMYLTCFSLLCVSLFLYFSESSLGAEYIVFLLIASTLILILALISDTKQQSRETEIIKNLNRGELLSFLTNCGFIFRKNIVRLDHYGFVTSNLELFEDLWCKKIGYTKYFVNKLSEDKCNSLFGVSLEASLIRYKLLGSPDLEVHYIENDSLKIENGFFKNGLNHVCIYVDDREKFVKELKSQYKIVQYKNPEGWMNLFLIDSENNWIEVKTSLSNSYY